MVSPSYPVSSIGTLFSLISNHTPSFVFSLHPLPTFTPSVTKPQAAPPLSFISDAAVFPNPLLLRDCGFDPLRLSGGGSHRAMARCWTHPGMSVGPCCC